MEKAFLLKYGDLGNADKLFPTQYFSIKWEGYLKPTYTETFWFHIEAFKTSEFFFYLDGELILSNRFQTTNERELPFSAYFTSKEMNLVKD
jgi:hypothetical protein